MALHIVLVHPQIPPNTGNIARLCAAMQMTLHLVKPLGFQTDDATLKRAGLDYWPHVSVVEHESYAAFDQKTEGARRFFLSTKGKKPYTEMSYQDGDYLVFGSETKGLAPEILQKNAETLVTIPMTGPIRSLNLSSSVAMVAGEALRQIRIS